MWTVGLVLTVFFLLLKSDLQNLLHIYFTAKQENP